MQLKQSTESELRLLQSACWLIQCVCGLCKSLFALGLLGQRVFFVLVAENAYADIASSSNTEKGRDRRVSTQARVNSEGGPTGWKKRKHERLLVDDVTIAKTSWREETVVRRSNYWITKCIISGRLRTTERQDLLTTCSPAEHYYRTWRRRYWYTETRKKIGTRVWFRNSYFTKAKLKVWSRKSPVFD